MKVGTSTQGLEVSPRKRRQLDAKRRREEERWRELSGPVIVRTLQAVEDVGQPRIYSWGANT